MHRRYCWFQDHWIKIDKSKYSTYLSDKIAENSVECRRNEILEFLRSSLEEKSARDDYREKTELSIIFLRDIPPKELKFSAPGAMH